MGDPCECFFDHEAAMRRLLSLLRDTQNFCTDSECVTDNVQGAAGGSSMIMWSLLWTFFAMAMYFLRPNSMRSNSANTNEKPGPSGGNNNQPPPPTVG